MTAIMIIVTAKLDLWYLHIEMTQALWLGNLPELLLNTACSTWQGFAGHSSFLLKVEG